MTQSKKFDVLEKRKSLYMTIALLAAGFALLVLFLFIFSGFFPSVFGQCVAVVEINDPLTTKNTEPSLFYEGMPGSEEMAESIMALNERPDIASVVFVINSPGGSVVATREVYNAIDELKKPKVAYLREIATSGAYYIAAPADYIVSDPDTVTGSIGVIATFADMSGLFEKIGLNITSVKSGVHKDIGFPARPMSDAEKEIVLSLVNEVFEEFKSVIIKHRGEKLNSARFQEILDGRIISGRQAKGIGLVDELGTKADAIAKAAELAGLEGKPRICHVSLKTEGGGIFNLKGALQLLLQEKSGPKIAYE